MQGTMTLDDLRSASGPLIGDVNIVISPPSGGPPKTRRIESTGLVPYIGVGTVTQTVRVNLEEYFRSIWDFGFFATDGFLAGSNLQIDSYNSNLGAYGGENMHRAQGHIGTNATGD
jgi:hypothetical protein